MPKLLSQKEVNNIAAKMTAAYGLPPAKVIEDAYFGSPTWNVRVEMFREILVDRFTWTDKFKKARHIRVRDFYASDYEDALLKLQQELARFDARAKVAEQFRDKYDLQEVDELFDEVLRKI